MFLSFTIEAMLFTYLSLSHNVNYGKLENFIKRQKKSPSERGRMEMTTQKQTQTTLEKDKYKQKTN